MNFVIPPCSKFGMEELEEVDIDRSWRLFTKGVYVWGLQTYLILKQRGNVPVTLSTRMLPGRVNLVHGAYLVELDPDPDAYVVALQADYPRVAWADLHVVQNQRQVGRRALWIPHWPQPGLIGRDPGRSGVRTIGFAGVGCYRPGGLRQWATRLAEIGCELVTLGPERWNDFSGVDVVLGIRRFGRHRFNRKPPTKLFNAWLAGTPLVAGHDSAFEQVGHPGEDYLRVATMEEGMAAIAALKRDPSLYARLVDRGRHNAQRFTRGRIARDWEWACQERFIPAMAEWRRRRVWQRVSWSGRVAYGRAAVKVKRRLRAAWK